MALAYHWRGTGEALAKRGTDGAERLAALVMHWRGTGLPLVWHWRAQASRPPQATVRSAWL